MICYGNPDIEIDTACVTSQSIVKETNVDIETEDGSVYNTTIRSSHCTLLVKTGSIRCKECQKQRGYLRVLKSRQAKGKQCSSKRTAVDSHVNYRFLSSTEKDEKIRNLHKQLNATKRTLKCVQSKLAEAIKNEGHVLDGEINEFLKGILIEGENLKDDLPEGTFRRLFWEQQLRAIRCTDARQIRWHPLMIKWCLNIKLRSSSAYTAIRNSGFIKLPSERTLRDYTHWTKISSGFQPSSFERLLFEANYKELEDWQKFIILLHDEVKIQSDLVYSKHTGELIGFVNVGDINNALVDFEKQCKEEIVNATTDIASYVLVFMVRGVATRLEYPLAHFPCNGCTADLLYPLLWDAVRLLETLGLKVIASTSDGASTNRKLVKMHKLPGTQKGEVVYKTKNVYSQDGRDLYFIADVPHLIKTVRNNWENSGWNKKSPRLWV